MQLGRGRRLPAASMLRFLLREEVGRFARLLSILPLLGILSFAQDAPITLPPWETGEAYHQNLLDPFFPACSGCVAVNVQGQIPPGFGFTSQGLVAGIPTEPGTFVFHVTWQSTGGSQSTISYKMVIYSHVDLPVATFPPATVGQRYSEALKIVDGVDPYTVTTSAGAPLQSIPLPAGLSIELDRAYIRITGTPCEAAEVSAAITVRDSLQPAPSLAPGFSVSKTISLVVNPVPALAVATSALPEGVVGESYRAQLSAVGGVPPYSWTASGLPDGLSLATDGAISGISAVDGEFVVPVQVADACADTATAALLLTVQDPQKDGCSVFEVKKRFLTRGIDKDNPDETQRGIENTLKGEDTKVTVIFESGNPLPMPEVDKQDLELAKVNFFRPPAHRRRSRGEEGRRVRVGRAPSSWKRQTRIPRVPGSVREAGHEGTGHG